MDNERAKEVNAIIERLKAGLSDAHDALIDHTEELAADLIASSQELIADLQASEKLVESLYRELYVTDRQLLDANRYISDLLAEIVWFLF